MSIRTGWGFISRYRYILAIFVLFLGGAVRANAQGCAGVSTDPQGAIVWTPKWCQEFSGAVGAPDPTAWTYDLGGGGFGNNELEIYCGPSGFAGNPSGCPSGPLSTGTVYLDGSGHLVIQAVDNGGIWYSGRMKTQGLQDFQYGRIEASIKLPDTTNQGLWPAFWSLGSDINTTPWPACGEADIMEVWSKAVLGGPGPMGNRSTLHTTVTAGSGLQPNGAFTFPSGQANTSFHTYGMIWSANMQQYYIDNPLQPYYISTPSNLPSGDTWPFNAKIFLLTNLAVGGTLGGTPSGSTPNPAIMMLDYVRQYQAAAVTAPALGSPTSISVKAGAATGNTSTFTPTLTPGTGFVYFSCSTDAPKASCAISTTDPLNKYVVSSSAAETVTVTATTTANTSMAKSIPPSFFNRRVRLWLPITMAGFFMSVFVVPSRRLRGRTTFYICMLVALIVVALTASCGGGNGTTTTTTTTPSGGTAPGTYSVTVYAFTESNVSDGTNGNADAKVAIPLTVN